MAVGVAPAGTPSRSTADASRDLIAHLLFAARRAELSDHDAAERQQRYGRHANSARRDHLMDEADGSQTAEEPECGKDDQAFRHIHLCNPKEARAWTVPRGTRAPQAAGTIHSDFERGFIRAETIAYDDYVAFGGEAGARDAGKLRLEGKDYVVADGDVLHFRSAT